MYKITLEYENGKYTIMAKCNEDTELSEKETLEDAIKDFTAYVDDITISEIYDALS